jgi:hypothetical protein
MLDELVRKRKVLRQQVEQLQAGRDRLAEAFEVVDAAMGTVRGELAGVLAEAKAAADVAAARVDATPDDDTVALEVMAEEARDVVHAGERESSLFSRLRGDAADEAVDDLAEEATDRETSIDPAPIDVGLDTGPDPVAAADAVVVTDAAPTAPVSESPAPPPPPPPPAPSSAPTSGSTPAVSAEVMDQRDGLLDDLSRSIVRRMKRLLSDEQNEVLDTIRRRKPFPGLDEVLGSEDEHIRRYAEAVLPGLRNAAAAGVELPGALAAARRAGPGAATTAAKRKGVAAAAARASSGTTEISVRDLAAVVAVDVVGALRPDLEHRVAVPDIGPDQLCDSVRLAYRDVRNRQVDAAVTDVVRRAFARGLRAAGTGEHPIVADNLLDGLPPE